MTFYVVEQILKRRTTKKGTMYLVKWKGYSLAQSTWEPQENLKYIKPKYLQVEEQQPTKKKTTKDSKKKIYKKKRQQSLQSSSGKRTNSNIEMTPSKDQITAEVKKEELESPSKEKNLEYTQQTSSKVTILKRNIQKNGQLHFIFKIGNEIREMSELQLNVLYPRELCIFYQKEIRKMLLFPQ